MRTSEAQLVRWATFRDVLGKVETVVAKKYGRSNYGLPPVSGTYMQSKAWARLEAQGSRGI